MAPSKGIPYTKGGILAITKMDEPIDNAAIITAKTNRLEALFSVL